MLSLCEMMLSHNVIVSQAMDNGTTTIGQVARSKSSATKLTREICLMAREICGGNGIILDNHVMKCLMDVEALHTLEGSYEMN